MNPYSQEFYSATREANLKAAREVVPFLMKSVNPRSVVDLGCAVGTWLSVFREHGVEDLLGMDGGHVDQDLLDISRDQFRVCDLEKPIQIEKTFDLAVSLEVAEHLAPSSAGVFVESLTRLAPVVLFSAAIPFQGGLHHVNEQWPQYWADLFARRNYLPIDCLRMFLWTKPHIAWWYSQNTMIYAKRDDISRYPELCAESSKLAVVPALVHPTKYLANADLSAVPLRRLLRAIPTSFLRGLKRTFQRP